LCRANIGCVPQSASMCGERCDRARWNAAASDVRASASSIETHKFIANGFAVSERISAITSSITFGSRPCAPNGPSPPKFDTAAVSLCDESPPSGPWMIGYSIPRTSERGFDSMLSSSCHLAQERRGECSRTLRFQPRRGPPTQPALRVEGSQHQEPFGPATCPRQKHRVTAPRQRQPLAAARRSPLRSPGTPPA
jgi:hypothetical protein